MSHRTRRDFLKASFAGAGVLAVGWQGEAAWARADVAQRLAVCSWSLQPSSTEDLLTKLAGTGLTRVQIALDPIRENKGGAWANFADLAAKRGVTCVSGMIGTVGEDYTTLESIRRTGGVVPDATWPQTWKNVQANADVADRLKLKLVTFHAGFLPHEESDPSFAKLQSRIQQIADLFAKRNMEIGLETGQETADAMAGFLNRLERKNVGVNLDPANIILYDKGDPVAAAKTLGRWVRQVHVKDAVRTKKAGTWGEEVPVGKGQVDWKAFFAALDAAGFKGDFCIEREAGTQRVVDIRTAREYVQKLS